MATSSLRPLRREQGLTLDALADRAQVTKSYLSKLERGLSTPSVAIAMALAGALNVEVGQIFGDPGTGEFIEIDRAAGRQRLATPSSTHGSSYDGLAVGMMNKQMTPFVIYPPTTSSDEFHEHDGDELVMILTGTVEIAFPNRVEQLDTGDSAYFKSGTLHRFRSIGTHEATILVVIGTDPGYIHAETSS